MARRPPALLAALLVAAACASEEAKLEDNLERAEAYREEEQYAEALIALRNALALRPQDAEINFQIAEVLIAQRRRGRALFHYREARRLDPGRIEAYLAEARLLRRADPEEAWKVLNAAIELQPGSAAAHRLLAELSLDRGDFAAALAAAERGATLDPDDPTAHFEVGRVYLARITRARREDRQADVSHYEAALAAFERAGQRAAEDDQWRSRLQRARVLARWPERSDEAPAAFRAAVAAADRSGSDAVVRAARATLDHAREARDAELRRWALERILASDDSRLGAWIELAALEERATGSGEDVYRRLLAARPQDADAHLAHARFLLAAGRVDDAVAHLEATADAGLEPARMLATLVSVQYLAGRAADAGRTVSRLELEHPGDPATELARAERLLEDGQVEEASEALGAIVGSRESDSALHLLARALLRQRRLSEARTAIDRALELAPRQARHRSLRARIAFRAGDWAVALEDLRWIRRRVRRLTRPERLLLARTFYESDRREPARRVLEPLMADPDPYLPALLEFVRREGQSERARARQALERAHELAPNHPRVLARLAIVDLAEGDRAGAMARLDAAIERAPTSVEARTIRAGLRADEGDLAGAVEDARAAFEAAPQRPDVALLLVRVLGSQGRPEEALEALEAQHAAGRLSPGVQVLLARLSRQLGRDERALEVYEQALEARSDLPLAKNDLAFILAERGEQLERSQQLASEALEALPGDHRVLHTLGYVHLRQGQPDLALARLEEAIAAADATGDTSATYHYHLGLALRGVRRNRSAAEAFERALAIDPDFPDAALAEREREAALAGAPPPTRGRSR